MTEIFCLDDLYKTPYFANIFILFYRSSDTISDIIKCEPSLGMSSFRNSLFIFCKYSVFRIVYKL